MKGKGLLKVTGILMIIGGIVMTIVDIIAMLGIAAPTPTPTHGGFSVEASPTGEYDA